MVSGNALLEEPVEQLQSEVVIAVVYAEAGYWRLVNSREPVENSQVGSVYALAPEPELEPEPEFELELEPEPAPELVLELEPVRVPVVGLATP